MRRKWFTKQHDAADCGPACLQMVAKHFGKSYSLQKLREKSYLTREGVSLLGISDAAESIGFRTLGVKLTYDKLITETELPCVLHWNQRHFVVLYKVSGKKNKEILNIADPAHGFINYKKKDFLNHWISLRDENLEMGICLLLEPTPDFYKQDDEKLNKKNFGFLFSYLKPHHKFLVQLVLGMILGSLLQLIFPFLTQSIVDVGINNQDLSFITLVLIAQLILFISQMTVEFIRGWILLHISTRINISLISDFLIKLMKLPIGFFDTKMIGDLMQRIGDHSRIESFLTTSSLQILFSLIMV